MAKAKDKTAPEPKTWYRLELIKTGEGYETREYRAFLSANQAYVYASRPPVETVLVDIDLRSSPGLADLIKALSAREEEVQRLKDTIKQYQDASKKIQEAV